MIFTDLLITLQNSGLAVELRSASSVLSGLRWINTAIWIGLAVLVVTALSATPRVSRPLRLTLIVLGLAGIACGGLLFVATPFAYASFARAGIEVGLILAALALAHRRSAAPVHPRDVAA